MIFLLRCTHCSQRMKFQSPTKVLAGKRKRCVYCGKSFNVFKGVLRQV
ncbi:MAG: hypothetical protein ABIH34_01520 [Nanoarchaeota archaeon]